jgi:SAM-dependent methyltransferase
MTSWTSGYVADIDYTHGFYRELTPNLLSLSLLAKGKRGLGDLQGASYCELGCGQGFSANLLAAANPQIDFYATDFDPSHIHGAKLLAAEAATPNVHFFDQSFADFLVNPALPSFDIISLHGIYSWIAVEHRTTIVDLIRRKLKPGGVVYISYNCLPGWSAAAPLRQLLYMHAKSQGGPTAGRLDPALDFIEKLFAAEPAVLRANPALKTRLDGLRKLNRNYLAHEYLNDSWTLFYHADVAAEMGAAKLSHVGSAALLEHIDAVNLTAPQQQILAETGDHTLRETLRDYMVNQQFRRDVFALGPVTHSVSSSRQQWLEMRFALSTTRADVPMTVKGSLGEATLQENIYRPLVDALARGPTTVRQLLAEPVIAAIGWERLLQALTVLVGAGHVQPCLPAKDEGKRAQRTRAFNSAICKRAEDSGELQFLASPVTGGGLLVNRFEQLFLVALSRGLKEPHQWANHAWSVLSEHKETLVKDGKALETAEDNSAELLEQAGKFAESRLALLKTLQVTL